MNSLDDIAGLIDPAKARRAIAGICALVGSGEWNADLMDPVFDQLRAATSGAGIPAFDDIDDDEATDFWSRLRP